MKCSRCGYFYSEHPVQSWQDWSGKMNYRYMVDKNCLNVRRQTTLDKTEDQAETAGAK